jgi:hypothetical protein
MDLGSGFKNEGLCRHSRRSDWSSDLVYYNAIVRAI